MSRFAQFGAEYTPGGKNNSDDPAPSPTYSAGNDIDIDTKVKRSLGGSYKLPKGVTITSPLWTVVDGQWTYVSFACYLQNYPNAATNLVVSRAGGTIIDTYRIRSDGKIEKLTNVDISSAKLPFI
jgi:hypothetical protein